MLGLDKQRLSRYAQNVTLSLSKDDSTGSHFDELSATNWKTICQSKFIED
jgi:hypothetical protein